MRVCVSVYLVVNIFGCLLGVFVVCLCMCGCVCVLSAECLRVCRRLLLDVCVCLFVYVYVFIWRFVCLIVVRLSSICVFVYMC